MRCTNGIKEMDVSPKAFNVIYINQGFTKAEEVNTPMGEPTDHEEIGRPRDIENIDDMKVTELRELAKAKGLEGVSSLNKEELLSILKEVV